MLQITYKNVTNNYAIIEVSENIFMLREKALYRNLRNTIVNWQLYNQNLSETSYQNQIEEKLKLR